MILHTPVTVILIYVDVAYKQTNKQTNSVTRVRERTIPTERPSLVGEVSEKTFTDRGVSRSQRGGSRTAAISVF
jgi:hypothetical protein